MEYTLKDKLHVTKEFLNDLEIKSWQEIKHLQSQIANIEATPEATEVIKLLKNLLTSYYVFTGGLENLADTSITQKTPKFTEEASIEKELTVVEPEVEIAIEDEKEDFKSSSRDVINQPDFEPFEYFVDFDEPVGEPLTDNDIYN
jgi:hypothetical protein